VPCSLILSVDLQNQALQILGLGNSENHWVVWGCPAALQQANPALRISRGGGYHAVEFVPGNIV
jgi:hypothetical protein